MCAWCRRQYAKMAVSMGVLRWGCQGGVAAGLQLAPRAQNAPAQGIGAGLARVYHRATWVHQRCFAGAFLFGTAFEFIALMA